MRKIICVDMDYSADPLWLGIEDVDDPEIFKPTWVDIMSAMKRPRYHRLHSNEGRWLMFGIAKHIETRTSEIKRYKDVLNMVDEAFDYVLQYGYDEGVLTAQDCEQYNYTPKPVIANKE